MSSGIKYVENGFINGDDALTYYYPDLHELALRKSSIDGEPGKTWLYNNYHPLMLGIILERATGTQVAKYLETKLWQPMGAEYPASWSLDSNKTAFEKMESGINARAIDFAKLGWLYLNGGAINGQQILPADWVDQATRMDTTVDRGVYYPSNMEQPYGHIFHQLLWWGVQEDDGSHGFAAEGNFGQQIFVYPEKRIIIVRNGERYGIPTEEWFGLLMAFSKALN
jgi:CubicO group peptidase (beta-lactamase class C family)